MTFSLVVATLNRVEELRRMLGSVAATPEAQAGKVQVIVADQNPDDRLDAVARDFGEAFEIRHLRPSPLGLSRARNHALREVRHDVVAFPDDDCVYAPDTLTRVKEAFDRLPSCMGFSGRAVSLEGRPYGLKWPAGPEAMMKSRIWRQGLSVSLFLRRATVDRIGPFDETLGLGAGTRWGSGEDTDYLLRALAAGLELRYDPAIIVRHPAPPERFGVTQRERAYGYALGMGRVLRSHRFPSATCLRYVLRAAGGSLLYAATGRLEGARYYAKVAQGRLEGWLLP